MVSFEPLKDYVPQAGTMLIKYKDKNNTTWTLQHVTPEWLVRFGWSKTGVKSPSDNVVDKVLSKLSQYKNAEVEFADEELKEFNSTFNTLADLWYFVYSELYKKD